MFILATVRLFLVSKLNHATLRRRKLQEDISNQIYQQGVWVVCFFGSGGLWTLSLTKA
jgi:hypothetical protein